MQLARRAIQNGDKLFFYSINSAKEFRRKRTSQIWYLKYQKFRLSAKSLKKFRISFYLLKILRYANSGSEQLMLEAPV